MSVSWPEIRKNRTAGKLPEGGANGAYLISVAVGLHLPGMEDHADACDLRCDQERRNHGGQAYQAQKLIHRKHRSSPQNVISTGAFSSPVARSAARRSEADRCR